MSKKALDKILCISGRKTAVPKKTVKRWPIGFAKTGERLLSRVGCFLVARAQNDGPMRRLTRSTTLLQRSRDRFRSRSVAEPKGFGEKQITRTAETLKASRGLIHPPPLAPNR